MKIINEDKKIPFGYIYKFTVIPTGKFYVGKRETSEFDNGYYGSGRDWKLEVQKYGKENIKREILDWAYSREELKEKEKYWIAKLDARNKDTSYNVHKGGNGGNMLGDTKAWSELHKGERNGRYGEPVSQETRDKIGHANSGKVRSQETKDKISSATKGVPKPDGFGAKISKATKGRPKSQETKDKISNSLKGTSWGRHSQESNDKISRALSGHDGLAGELNGMYGKRHSEASKEKMRANRKGLTTGKNNPKACSVQCIETGKIYDTIKDAELDTGASQVAVVCKGLRDTSTKVKLHWRYAENED